MKNLVRFLTAGALLTCAASSHAQFVSGIPVAVQKSNYSTINVTYVQMTSPLAGTTCDSNSGLVLRDSDAHSKVGVALAITALVTGKRFMCYVTPGVCERITGAVTTYPVCDAYPTLAN